MTFVEALGPLQACKRQRRVQGKAVERGVASVGKLEAGLACLLPLLASPAHTHPTKRWDPCRLAESGGAFDNVFVERGVASGEELLMRLARLRPLLADPPRQPVRLLVIDSVAHLFRDAGAAADGGAYGLDGGAYGLDGRGGGGTGAYAARAELLFRLAALLKLYADEFGLAVVVADVFTNGQDGRAAPLCRHAAGQRLQTAGREVAPALGLAWATCITQRLFLSRCPAAAVAERPAAAERDRGQGGCAGGGPPPQPVLRCMQVIFSPYLPAGFRYFTVTQGGLRGLPPGALQPGAAGVDHGLVERGAGLADSGQAHGGSLPSAQAQGCLLPEAGREAALAARAAVGGASAGAQAGMLGRGNTLPTQPCAAAPAAGGCQEMAWDGARATGSERVWGAENWEPSRARREPCSEPAASSARPLCSGVFAARH